jgi:secreted PhoX family phosphatase
VNHQTRTALGRFKHECAVPALTADGRVAVYSGDDAHFEHLYKFISEGQYSRRDRDHNMDLLDEGTLCGPELSSDERTFFCGIQHPGEGGGLPNSLSSWPDSNEPAKPSILSVWNTRGRKIGE